MTHQARCSRSWIPLVLCSLLAMGCGGGGGDGGDGPAIDLGAFPAATIVIGQADFLTDTANQGGPVAANGLNTPLLSPAAGSLYICDNNNSRILGYTAVPTADNADADFVLGQADFVSNSTGLSASAFNRPGAVASGGGRLAVADTGNNRVLLWPGLPKATTPATVVVGQSDLVSNSTGTTATTMSIPGDVQLAGGRLFVADSGNQRVLIWNTVPTTSGVAADVVLGQPDFTSNGPGTTASSFIFPKGIWSDGVRLAVADVTNHRILLWNTIPTTNGAPADVVLGQPDFTSNAPGLGAGGLNQPWDINSNGTQFFIADSDNNRIVIHGGFPTTNNRPADAVVGQGDFARGAQNDLDQDGTQDATPSARTLWFPTGVLPMGNQLLVVDSDNSRVLVFGP